LAALLGLAGCGSFKDDMQMMCDASKHVDLVGIFVDERAARIAEHVARNTRSSQARQMFQTLASVDQARRHEVLAQAVKDAGLDPAQCEMLQYYE
jgi:hypothetical protein